EIERLKEELVLLDEATEKLHQALSLGLKLKKEGRLTPDKARLLSKIQKVFREKVLAQANLQEKIKEKEEALQAYTQHTLKVLDRVYPGVRIAIGRYEYEVRKEIPGPVEFFLEGKTVKSRPLEGK
ncbi:FapA family protein, partial [Thermosulfurimonas sp.]|uniref:FapA family protein n=1 Tax=Thermosulfurimonas sp. TaxID=2080236 RepID=UPI0025FCA048